MSTGTAALAEQLALAREAGCLPNLHGVLVRQGGSLLFEQYFAGPDAVRARPLGVVRLTPETLHDLRSVTKSIVGLLYGVALAAGQVPPPEAELLKNLPGYAELAEPRRDRLTIHHALSMTLGTAWDEISLPYADPRSETAMDAAPDRHRFVLAQPVIEPPGQRWVYHGGATALLTRLIAKGSGRPLDTFAQEALFDPLGITQAAWHRGANGLAIAASGLRLTPRDLARIGAVALDGGRWQGRQITPAPWLASCFAPSVTIPDSRRYGYHWYLGTTPADDGAGGLAWEETISAIGYGGQRLFLLPRRDLVVAVTGGRYGASDHWRPPLVVLRDVVLPALSSTTAAG